MYFGIPGVRRTARHKNTRKKHLPDEAIFVLFISIKNPDLYSKAFTNKHIYREI